MNQNKDIYLIDLGDEITWCDCPEPSDDTEPEDVTHYVRVDVFNEKLATIDKLVTVTSELTDWIEDSICFDDEYDLTKIRDLIKQVGESNGTNV